MAKGILKIWLRTETLRPWDGEIIFNSPGGPNLIAWILKIKKLSWLWLEGSVTMGEESDCYGGAGFDDGGEDVSQGMWMASRQWNRWISSRAFIEEHSPVDVLILVQRSMQDFLPEEL